MLRVNYVHAGMFHAPTLEGMNHALLSAFTELMGEAPVPQVSTQLLCYYYQAHSMISKADVTFTPLTWCYINITSTRWDKLILCHQQNVCHMHHITKSTSCHT